MNTTFDDPNEPESLKLCYEILPFPEAIAIWNRCPLPAPDENQYKSQRDDD